MLLLISKMLLTLCLDCKSKRRCYMYRKTLILVFSVAICLAVAPRAEAQRTARGQFILNAEYVQGVFPARSSTVMGGSLGLGQYLGSCYWEAGARFAPLYARQSVGTVAAYGGFMYRVVGTRSHSFNVYAGGRLYVGGDYQKPVLEEGQEEVSLEKYTWGLMVAVAPRLELELFVLRRFALTAGFSVPVKIQSQMDLLSGRATFGIRYNL